MCCDEQYVTIIQMHAHKFAMSLVLSSCSFARVNESVACERSDMMGLLATEM